jgi:hypothetical protein
MISRSKKIYLALTVIVPFLIYSIYYYGIILKNAPYNFKEFKSLTFKYGNGENLVNQYTSADGIYRYLKKNDSMVVKRVKLTRGELQEIHKKAYHLGLWNFPSVIGDPHSPAPHYYLELTYNRKTKSVLYDVSYTGDDRLRVAIKTMMDMVDKTLNDAERSQ